MKDAFDSYRLEKIARKLRSYIIQMVALAGSGHNGGSLSAIDIITYLYFHRMKVDPANPAWPDRDRFVLSKGHCCPALYAALAERGFFPVDVLWTLRDIGSVLQGHPDMRKTPGVDMTSGSLGQGFSSSVGMALAGKLDRRDYVTYCMLGDGELQEGQVWEAAMTAAQQKLDNLIAFVDDNGLQTDGPTSEIVNVEPVVPRFQSFGWEATEINGHDFGAIHRAVEANVGRRGKPHVIVAHTVKGKGVSFMEGNYEWHSGPTSAEQTAAALSELSGGER